MSEWTQVVAETSMMQKVRIYKEKRTLRPSIGSPKSSVPARQRLRVIENGSVYKKHICLLELI